MYIDQLSHVMSAHFGEICFFHIGRNLDGLGILVDLI